MTKRKREGDMGVCSEEETRKKIYKDAQELGDVWFMLLTAFAESKLPEFIEFVKQVQGKGKVE